MTVAVIFGGRSCEHNVSIVTGVRLILHVGGVDAGTKPCPFT